MLFKIEPELNEIIGIDKLGTQGKMNKRLLLVITMLSLAVCSKAQSLEFGLFGGGSYFITDVNPSAHFKDIKPAFGFVGRYYSGSRWAFRTSVTTTTSDSLSRLTDVSAVAEFNFFDYFTGSTKSYVTPFIFGGISTMFYQVNGESDKSVPLSFPFGVGVKYSVTKNLGLTFEWRMHKSTMDDLEGSVSAPNTYQNDWYNFTGLSIVYKFDLSNTGACSSFNKNDKY